MSDRLARLRAVPPARLIPFVGSGVSVAATGNARLASWFGLLEDGLHTCQRLLPDLPPDWAERTRARLDDADVITYLTIADEVTMRLRRVSDGREYAEWLKATVGALSATSEGLRLLAAIGRLNTLVVTTNYDRLLDSALERSTVTWSDRDACIAALRDAIPAVLHLHGEVNDADSIVLGSADYERLLGDELQRLVKQNLFTFKTLLLVGCGEGLRDRSIAPILSFIDRVHPPGAAEHYHLVLGKQLRDALRSPLATSIVPIAYGETYADLPVFLEKLADPSADLDVSQELTYWNERRPGRARTALLELAGPAEDALHDTHEAIRQALRSVGQVERRSAAPEGLRGRGFREQEEVHEQLAASVTRPAERLAFTAALVEQAIQGAEPHIGQLLARKFEAQLPRLEPLLALLNESESLCGELSRRASACAAELVARSDESGEYERPIAALRSANEHINEAADVISTLRSDFDERRRSLPAR